MSSKISSQNQQWSIHRRNNCDWTEHEHDCTVYQYIFFNIISIKIYKHFLLNVWPILLLSSIKLFKRHTICKTILKITENLHQFQNTFDSFIRQMKQQYSIKCMKLHFHEKKNIKRWSAHGAIISLCGSICMLVKSHPIDLVEYIRCTIKIRCLCAATPQLCKPIF